MPTRIRIVIAFALSLTFTVTSGALSSPANAVTTIVDTLDGSTIIGEYTFTITIPQLGSGGTVRLQIVDVYGEANYGIVPAINIQNAGSYTYTIDPFGTITSALLRLPAGSWGSNVYGFSLLRPGVNQIRVDYWDDAFDGINFSQQLLTNVTFKHACSPGSFSIDGGVPLDGTLACDPAEPGTFVAASGQTTSTDCPVGKYADVSGSTECKEARPGHFVAQFSSSQDVLCPTNTYQNLAGQNSCNPCPTNYTSGVGSDALADCIAPAVSQSPSTPTVAVVAAPAVDATPTVAKGKKISSNSLAKTIGMSIPKKAKVTLKVAKASKKFCRVSGTSIKALKVGSCVVTVKVNPKTGKTTTKTTLISIS